MPLILKTLDELHEFAIGVIRGLITDADTSPGSDYWITARMVAALAHGNQSQAEYLLRQILPSTAESTYLVLHAALRGLSLAPAAKARGRLLLVEIDAGTGLSAGSVQASGSVYKHADGRSYTQTNGVTIINPAWTGKTCGPGASKQRLFVHPDTTGMAANDPIKVGGVRTAIKEVIPSVGAVDLYTPLASAPAAGAALAKWAGVVVGISPVTLEAQLAGKAGNKSLGDVLVLQAPAHADLDPNAVVLEMSGGGDLEDPEQLRRRTVDRMSVRPAAGNVADYREWSRETPDVRLDDAFVYPAFRDLGTVDVIPFGVAGARQVGTEVATKVSTYLGTVVHFSDDRSVAAFAYAAAATDVQVQITPAAGFEPDWTGTRTEGGGTSTTLRVYVTATPVGTIEVGDRIVVYVLILGRRRPYVRKVVAVTSTYLDLDPADPLPAAPFGGEIVRPGAANTQDVIDNIEAFFDDLGPGDTTPATRHPSPGVVWPDVLSRFKLGEAILEAGGMKTMTLSAPAGDVTPAAKQVVKLGQIVVTYA